MYIHVVCSSLVEALAGSCALCCVVSVVVVAPSQAPGAMTRIPDIPGPSLCHKKQAAGADIRYDSFPLPDNYPPPPQAHASVPL